MRDLSLPAGWMEGSGVLAASILLKTPHGPIGIYYSLKIVWYDCVDTNFTVPAIVKYPLGAQCD